MASRWAWACALAIAASGGGAARAADEPAPLRVVMLSGSEEYESDRSLDAFRAWLEARYPARCTVLKARGTSDLPGLEALEDCDVALVFTRRLTLPDDQLERVRRYLTSGRPIVGVRTASHAFQNWLEFDRLVLGGSYKGHYGEGKSQRATVEEAARSHPVLNGVDFLASRASVYKSGPIADDCTLLMTARSPEAAEPAVWTREHNGGRVFYTTLGAQGDFENQSFLRMLAQALFWTARREIPEPPSPGAIPLRPKIDATIALSLRRREPTGAGGWRVLTETREVPASEVGVVICDMWDLHWCRGATERADAIAGRMNEVVSRLREKGVQIVHAPSETMPFYAGTPQRLRAQVAPKADPPAPPAPRDVPPVPIDDRDGGCDTEDMMYLAWTRQNPRITIGEFDAITDQGDEVYNLFRQLGVTHVLVMGVHTNMCILNRSFAIKAMTARGMSCVLVRDLTDAMYDPNDAPRVPHDEGTNLVVEYIETYWCPSAESGGIGVR